jgi:hypothetical protein
MIQVGDRVRGRTNATRVRGTNAQKCGAVTALVVTNNKRKFNVTWDDDSSGTYVINAIIREVAPANPGQPAQIGVAQPPANGHEQSDESGRSDTEEEDEDGG